MSIEIVAAYLNSTTVPIDPFLPLLTKLNSIAANLYSPSDNLIQKFVLSALLGLCFIFVAVAIIFRWKSLWFVRLTPSDEDEGGRGFVTPNSVACWLMASSVFLLGQSDTLF